MAIITTVTESNLSRKKDGKGFGIGYLEIGKYNMNNRFYKMHPCELILFDLLKMALWNQKQTTNFTSLTAKEWALLYKLSIKQGVQNLTFDVVCRLQEKCQFDEALLLSWAANVRLQEYRFKHNSMVMGKLNNIFRAYKQSILLLKGSGLSVFYPKMEYREFGDIDIYTDNHRFLDEILLQCCEWTKDHHKHSVFSFEGVPVENHKTFIDLVKDTGVFCRKRKQAFETIERELHSILKDEGSLPFGTYDSIKIPSATFNFIFLLMHSANHLGGELVIRHICDWACFLAANKGKYNENRIEKILQLLNFQKVCFLMTDAAITYLGMPIEYAPSFYKEMLPLKLREKFIHSLFHSFPSPKEVGRNTLGSKWRRFYSKQWKYNLIYQEYLPERLMRTLILWYQKNR